jgi:DNA primase
MNSDAINSARRTGHPDEVRVNCPYCPDTKYHMYINVKKRLFHCFRCGASGRLEDGPLRLSLYQQMVQEFLQPPRQTTSVVPVDVQLPTEFKRLVGRPTSFLGRRALSYLVTQRGLTLQEVDHYHLGYCAMGHYQERIIIPILEQGELVYFVARSFTNRQPKYLNPHIEKHGVLFRGTDLTGDFIVVCEGVFDAIRLSRLVPVVALLGKEASDLQLMKIREIAEKAIVMLDADALGHAIQLCLRLLQLMPTILIMLNHSDPGSLTTDELQQHFEDYFQRSTSLATQPHSRRLLQVLEGEVLSAIKQRRRRDS